MTIQPPIDDTEKEGAVLLAVTGKGEIWRTNNGGLNWTNVWKVGEDKNKIYKTHWDTENPEVVLAVGETVTVLCYFDDPDDPKFLCERHPFTLRSTNSGVSWEEVDVETAQVWLQAGTKSRSIWGSGRYWYTVPYVSACYGTEEPTNHNLIWLSHDYGNYFFVLDNLPYINCYILPIGCFGGVVTGDPKNPLNAFVAKSNFGTWFAPPVMAITFDGGLTWISGAFIDYSFVYEMIFEPYYNDDYNLWMATNEGVKRSNGYEIIDTAFTWNTQTVALNRNTGRVYAYKWDGSYTHLCFSDQPTNIDVEWTCIHNPLGRKVPVIVCPN